MFSRSALSNKPILTQLSVLGSPPQFYPENRNHRRQSWQPSENTNAAAEQAISDDPDIWNPWPWTYSAERF